MRSLLIFAFLASFTVQAAVFTAAKNISERLEVQEHRVGSCTEVQIVMTTLREIDGDHEFLGFEGVAADGRKFAFAKEYGIDGSRPRVLRRAPGEYLVLVFTERGLGHGQQREPILTLRTDGEGKIITDLISPDGRALCGPPRTDK